ncbi:MAG: hypothetical protein HY508_10160 [Acidobacteria bacterium]|nr:hypothetical protein [Acidobacteriota bacterium]
MLDSELHPNAYAAVVTCSLSLTLTACGSTTSSSEGAHPTVHKIAAGQTIRLAFAPNAPAAFWEMAGHGLKKFEKKTGVHVELKYPPTGSVEEQNQIEC